MTHVPSKMTYIDGPNTPDYRYHIEIIQTHQYHGGKVIELPSVKAAYSASHGGGNGIGRSFDLGYHFFNYVSTRTVEADRYGRFIASLRVRIGAAPHIYEKAWVYDWIPYFAEMNEYEPGTNPGNGQGLTPDDLNNQPINTGGFWQNIFQDLLLPSDQFVNDFKNTTGQWATWGPFGIFNVVNGAFSLHQSQLPEQTYVLPFGGYEMDLSPYEPFIKFCRALMAGALYLILIFAAWKRVHMKA